MALRRGRELSVGLEALNLFSRLDSPATGANTTVRDLARRERVREMINTGLDQSLDNKGRLHGWRVQGLFEAMIVCLGGIRLIKEEDSGSYYFDDANGNVKPPDFRIVRTTAANFYCPSGPRRRPTNWGFLVTLRSPPSRHLCSRCWPTPGGRPDGRSEQTSSKSASPWTRSSSPARDAYSPTPLRRRLRGSSCSMVPGGSLRRPRSKTDN